VQTQTTLTIRGDYENHTQCLHRSKPAVRNRFLSRIFTVVAVIFLLQSGTAQSNENIVVAYSGISGFQGPLWTFSGLRLFAKYSLNPEIVLIAGGTQSMQALLSNYTHFALASATPPLTVGLQGGNVDHRRRAQQISL
jgi:hypothetical protein